MNKIVIHHYPASKLPADLRKHLDAEAEVTVTLESEDVKLGGFTYEELISMRDSLSPTEDDPVERIRKLRDEWD